ncbi:PHD and RING finger domain-containing protein 1 isoform X2 [Thunnus maccoyii]|uniref:PHD and RING finger domain-containing protein 1 isoform X2 n=1 Tax=Thunnus maccoyii TaxID=8240 RepID=UPI001C4D1482|nr:PHD and RING finger domain-containing protein 1 isoform X2 [Thunnus maccoyii]
MDEDDSQDELINRNASHSKGKRAALWAISDDSDNVDEESEEGESDSGEEEDEDHLDGEDEEEGEEENEEDDDEEEEEEEDAKAEEAAFGGTSADLAGMSSDEDSEKCPICLNSFNSQPVATPESCEHYFCLDCILEWAKNANSCPVDRIAFNNIYLRKCYGGKVRKMITVQKPVKEGQEETVDLDLEQTSCEVCGGSDREDRLLLCDGCDAGYHTDCLTPPLDAVPVEEWFCPECQANNRHSRGSAEELSDTESLPSTARPATSRSQSRAAGPTRAIARTQQSERVRASVNRHRITQARTSQLAPTYLMQSTWLDETINAVVAGLNRAVYVRDLTPRVPSTRRRKTGKRRKVKSKKTSTAKGKKGKSSSTGVRRRRRKVRRTKSGKKVLKKAATPRSRIANSLGIAKDKRSSSLPTVYRPSEHTLSSMRADIGAASLSIYGDPFDLDPFSDHEEEEQQEHVTTLLEAKRRGISRSALRSHQPVARPVTASISRRGMDVPQSGGVVEAAPVPDLLGSILSGQSMLLMDSSDVVINRDGSLKATKPMSLPSALKPDSSKSSSSGDSSTQINPGISPNPGDTSLSVHYNGDLPGSSRSTLNGPFSQSSSRLPPFTPSSTRHTQPPLHTDLPPRGHPSLQPPRPTRPIPTPGHRGTNGVGTPRETTSSSIHPASDSSSKSKTMVPSQSQPKKASTKPMWVDVSVLPRIPKIRRESSNVTNDGTNQIGSSGSNISSSSSSSRSSRGSSNSYGMPETGMNNLAGDKNRQQSVDQQQGRAEGQAHRHRRDGASSSSAFSNSFSSSSSSTGSPASQPCYPSLSSSSSSSVSFRINSSGNSWHSRRLSTPSSSASGGSMQEHWREKEDEAKKRQLHRDKQMLLASRTPNNKEQDRNNIYDPFNPTLSDSSSSDGEAESTSLDSSSQRARLAPSLGNKECVVQSKQKLVTVKTETQESEISQEEPRGAIVQETVSQVVRCSEEKVKVEKESRLVDIKIEEQTSLLGTEVKKEPGLNDTEEAEKCGNSVKSYLSTGTADTTPPVHHSLDLLKTEKETLEEESGQSVGTPSSAPPNYKNDSSTSSSAPAKKKQKTEVKSESKPCSRSPSRDLSQKKKTSKRGVSSKERHSSSSSSETDRDRRGDHNASGQGGWQKERNKDRERSARRSRSREKRRARSTSESSRSNSPDRTHRKRRRSRSKDGRRSRSGSNSSSRECSRRNKHKQKRNDGRERDHNRRQVSKDKRRGRSRSKSRSRSRSKDKRRGRSRSKSRSRSRSKDKRRGRSRSKSRSRSRSKDKRCGRSRSKSRSRSRSKDRKHGRSSQSKSRSRSRSRERRKDHTRPQQPSLSTRDKVESQPKDKRRQRSRSSSRERRKEERSSKSSQKTSGSGISSSKDRKDKKKEKDMTQSSIKDEKVAIVNKQEMPSSASASNIKKEGEDLRADSQASTAEMMKEIKVVKEIKKEKQPSLDMFEDSPITKQIKKEGIDTLSLIVAKNIKQEEIEEHPIKIEPCEIIKAETCEITAIKSEPSSPEVCHLPPVTSFSTLTTPVAADSLLETVSLSHSDLKASEQPNTVGLSVPIKQEVQQPSDSDDDFNVDVMLDNLDYVKSERAEGSAAAVKQKKGGQEGKNEGEQVPAIVGAKSKTQVKRVTWNIQEPEGPQPEKSASKLALYKLKLKQEGARRPSSTVQTSSQDITGPGSVSDPSKKGGVGPHSTNSRSDSVHPEGLSTTGQGEAEEGDVSRNDKYLKKLHMQERAIEEVKLAIKPFYQRRDINKDEYKEILRKAVQKVCHSKSGEINPVKVGNLVKAYVDKYKHARKHKKGEDLGKGLEGQTEAMKTSDSP